MYRFQELEKAINKGVPAIERANASERDRILEWSPNNFRRLIIGADWAIIQHFVTSQRSRTLIERVDLRNAANKDSELLANEPQKYKSILDAIVSGRVLSSVEEIIFCQQGYMNSMAKSDTSLTRLSAGNTTLETRFPRLRHISYAPCDIETMWKILPEAKPADKLLIDAVKAAGIPIRSVVEQHEDDWWSGTSLRPQYYSMDEATGPLAKYFDDLKVKQESVQRSERLEQLDSKHDTTFLEKNLPPAHGLIGMLHDLFDKSQQVFSKASIISKAEWAAFLEFKNMGKGIRFKVAENKDLVTAMRRIDFARILQVMRDSNIDPNVIGSFLKFRDTLYVHIMNNEEEYKRESNKDSFVDSMQTILKLAPTIYNHAVNIVYLSFLKYLTRNSVEYAPFFYEKLKAQIPSLMYTRSQVEYWNNGHLEIGVAKQAMDKINATEVTVDVYGVKVKSAEVNKLLHGLLQVASN